MSQANDRLEVGAKVQMNTDMGSAGEVVEARADGSGYFIMFHFGKGPQGQTVTARSGLIPRKHLTRITESEFQARSAAPMWGKAS